MIPIMQTITTKGDGNCTVAAIASLFDLTLEQVPHFNRYGNDWYKMLKGFIALLGYKYSGDCYFNERKFNIKRLRKGAVKGFIYAGVASKTYGLPTTHAVIINLEGLVVHDPNPNKLWEGINIVETRDLRDWMIIKKL